MHIDTWAAPAEFKKGQRCQADYELEKMYPIFKKKHCVPASSGQLLSLRGTTIEPIAQSSFLPRHELIGHEFGLQKAKRSMKCLTSFIVFICHTSQKFFQINGTVAV